MNTIRLVFMTRKEICKGTSPNRATLSRYAPISVYPGQQQVDGKIFVGPSSFNMEACWKLQDSLTGAHFTTETQWQEGKKGVREWERWQTKHAQMHVSWWIETARWYQHHLRAFPTSQVWWVWILHLQYRSKHPSSTIKRMFAEYYTNQANIDGWVSGTMDRENKCNPGM